jgi:hypothetical protein
MTMRESITTMLAAANRGFVEEAGSPRAVNAALLVIGVALVAALAPERLDEEK